MQKCNLCRKPVRPLRAGFVQCSHCKTIHFFEASTPPYEEDYFGSEYKEQYKKTYLQDEENIRKKSKERIEIVTQTCGLKKFNNAPLRILEVGSAAGFFLDEAKLQWTAGKFQGWEISQNMSRFAGERGHDVLCGDYFSLYRKWKLENQEAFDMLFAFYTAEHFDDQNAFWYSASQLIKVGGYLILTLPSYYGPMFYLHKKKWFRNHPQDHFADYSPYSLSVLCKNFSFALVAIFADAVHPERILPLSNRAPQWAKNIVAKLQKKFLFADTMLVILQRLDT